MSAHPEPFKQLAEEVDLGFPNAIAELSALVRIPSVSWDGYDLDQVLLSAQATKSLFEKLEIFDHIAIDSVDDSLGRPGRPAVLATKKARNGKPTVLLYAHHDVQPWGNEEDWDTPPFEPTLVGDRLYGRGASDDKAGIIVHYSALHALKQVLGTDFDLGVNLFIEGEEEFGSRSFVNFLEKFKANLAADIIIVADSDNWDDSTPALTVALRGNVTFRLDIRTLAHASHSGMYGGAVPDAPLAMIKTLASLWDESGAVAVPGLNSRDAEVPVFTEDELRIDAGLLPGVSSTGSGNVLSRIWNQPALTVTGIDMPSVRDASNTLTPSVGVKISARIAPGQSAEAAFAALKSHLEENAAFGAQLEFSDVDFGDPFLVDTSGPAVAEILESMNQAWDKEPVMTGIGGSIPFIPDLLRVFPGAEILVTGVEDPGTKAHSPNESQHLGVLRKAILTETLFLEKMNR